MKGAMQPNKQSGAVSLFVVIFAALLLTAVTVGFVQIMLKDQQQATTSDLSQSAYDSAQAGVEDAKRLLLLNQACRNNTAASTVNCNQITNALTPAPGQSETSCDALSTAGIVGKTNDETLIEQSTGDQKLDQAYTCVKIGINTDDYKGEVSVNESKLVPISGVSTFDSVELSWFSRDDISTSTSNPAISFPASGGETPLPPMGEKWQFNYPSLMRTQLLQTGGSFKLTDFDDTQDGKSNANTLFLYPSLVGLDQKDFALDGRRNPANAPQQVRCESSLATAEYACKVTIKLPTPIDGNAANRNAFLRLTSLYNGAHFSLKLKNGSEYVKFNGVQPEVDSTGRANDVFRRVKARVELTGDFTYPEAAIDMQGNLCKNFTVTDADEGYSASSSCTP